jgi:hypothetical protein
LGICGAGKPVCSRLTRRDVNRRCEEKGGKTMGAKQLLNAPQVYQQFHEPGGFCWVASNLWSHCQV